MDKHVFYYQDENLSAEKASHSTLKMIVGTDGLSIVVLSSENVVLGLDAIKVPDNAYPTFDVLELLASHKFLTFPFRKVITALSAPMVTLVPNRLFSPEECPKYFQLLQPDIKDTSFNFEVLDSFGCHLVWGAASQLQPFVNRYQPRHLAAALIPHFHALASREGYSVFMNIRGNHAQFTVFDLGSLVFYNTFEFQKPTDLLYFTLLVFEMFRINPEQVPLQVCGALWEGSEHYKLLYKYIQHIQFISPVGLPKTSMGENALPDHFWFDLFSI